MPTESPSIDADSASGLSFAQLQSVRGALLIWFEQNRRDLPWRKTREPYAIWLSEVMLQQTQVATALPYWHRFLERFPTLHSLAAASLSDVLLQWKGLGYYSRARNLHRAARLIAARTGGFPTTAEELADLPGFGRYTAGAVASIAFDRPAPAVDGNAARVLSRLFEVAGAPGDRHRENTLWSIALQLARGERPGDLNQALMELGALVCRAADPSCLLCPVRGRCRALKSGRVLELPPPRTRPARKVMTFAVAVWPRGTKVLMGRRCEKGLFGGLWELPSAEMGPGSTRSKPEATLGASLGVSIQVVERIGTLRRALTHRDLRLEVYRVRGRRSPRAASAYEEFRWVTPKEMDGLGMSTAMVHALRLGWNSARPPAVETGSKPRVRVPPSALQLTIGKMSAKCPRTADKMPIVRSVQGRGRRPALSSPARRLDL